MVKEIISMKKSFVKENMNNSVGFFSPVKEIKGYLSLSQTRGQRWQRASYANRLRSGIFLGQKKDLIVNKSGVSMAFVHRKQL